MTNIHPRYRASHVFNHDTCSRDAMSIEIFLDYNCPYSGKMFKKIIEEVIPQLIKIDGNINNYEFTFINVIQPWHGIQSSILHDVSFAISRVIPKAFYPISKILFDNIKKFYDSEVIDKSRNEIVEEILQLIPGEIISSDGIKQIKDLLSLQGNGNIGNGVSIDNKYFTRYSRTLGIHITPTVVVNGIIQSQIESSTESHKIIEILKNL